MFHKVGWSVSMSIKSSIHGTNNWIFKLMACAYRPLNYYGQVLSLPTNFVSWINSSVVLNSMTKRKFDRRLHERYLQNGFDNADNFKYENLSIHTKRIDAGYIKNTRYFFLDLSQTAPDERIYHLYFWFQSGDWYFLIASEHLNRRNNSWVTTAFKNYPSYYT